MEPASGLVNCFGDELCRELLLEQFLVLERIMMLCKRHCTRIKPAVDNFRYTVHCLTTIRTGEGHFIDVRSVEFYLGILRIAAALCELCSASDALQMSAFTLPDVERSSPITVTGDSPVLDILEPVTKTSLTDGFRNPVNGIVVADEVISYRGLTDVPGLACVVDERRVTSPAVRILMLELRSCKQLALCIQVFQNNRIGILYKHSCICSLFGHLTLAVYKLYKRKVVFASNLRVVFTECRCDVYDTGTVGHGNVSVTGYIMCLLILLLCTLCSACKERFVFLVLEFLTLIGF